MKSHVLKPALVALSAIIAFVAVIAAIQINRHSSKSVLPERDPLAPSMDAADVTAERSSRTRGAIDMNEVDRSAREKFGAMPSLQPSPELLARGQGQGAEPTRLERVRRIQEIRRTQGTAAALAALKAEPTLASR